jgi:hypothetical protein
MGGVEVTGSEIKAKANVQKYPWAAAIQKSLVETAQPWRNPSPFVISL